MPPEDGAEPPSVADLAEKIKSLRAAHTVEGVPQREAKRRPSAEEPVTARIRRRHMDSAEGEWQHRVSEVGERTVAKGVREA